MAARVRAEAVPPQALILVGIASVQFGAAFADKLFDQAGPAGVVLMRLGFGALVLLALTRPRLRGRSRRELRGRGGFGLVLACMNWSFYEALQLTAARPGRDHRVHRAAGGGDPRLAPAARSGLGGAGRRRGAAAGLRRIRRTR